MSNKNKTPKQPLNLKPTTGEKHPLNASAKQPLNKQGQQAGQPFRGNTPKDKNRDEKSGW